MVTQTTPVCKAGNPPAPPLPPLPVPRGLRHYGPAVQGADGIWRTARRHGFHLALAPLACGCFQWQEVKGKEAEAREMSFFAAYTCRACLSPEARARLRAEMRKEVRL